MADLLHQHIVDVVQYALRSTGDPHVVVGVGDSMETVAVWDSQALPTVFAAVNEAFGLAPDFEDAIHYTGVESLVSYVRAQAAP